MSFTSSTMPSVRAGGLQPRRGSYRCRRAGSSSAAMGPFTQLVPVPLALQIDGVYWWSLRPRHQRPHGGDGAGRVAVGTRRARRLHRRSPASFAITENIPAVPASVAWASGATPAGSLQSTAVSLAQPFRIGDHYRYSWVMSDGGFTDFAGPFSSETPTDLALFQLPPGDADGGPSWPRPHTPSPDGSYQHFPPLAIWQLSDAAGEDSQLLVWDDENRQVIPCPSSPTAKLGRPSLLRRQQGPVRDAAVMLPVPWVGAAQLADAP